MNKKIFGLSIIIAILLTGTIQIASAATWYAGNLRSSAYGVKALIYTPASAVYSPDFQDHWVSTPSNPSFVQTGWNYGPGVSTPRRYVEHLVGGVYGRDWYGTQAWATGVNYRADCGGNCSVSTWYAYINDNNKGGWGPILAPQEAQALSEVHENSNIVINTRFSSVYYRNAGGSWIQFNQANWVENAPYKVQKDFLYNYRTYR